MLGLVHGLPVFGATVPLDGCLSDSDSLVRGNDPSVLPVLADNTITKPGGIDGQGMARAADDGVGRERVHEALSSTSGVVLVYLGSSSSSGSSTYPSSPFLPF